MSEPNETEETKQAVIPPIDIHDQLDVKRSHNRTIAELFNIVKRAYENTRNNPPIGSVMQKFGYDRAKLELMNLLYTEAVASQSLHVQEHGESAESHADFQKLYDAACKEFATLKKVIRVALKKDSEKLVRLGVNIPKKFSINGTFDQMQTCYDNILNDQDTLNLLAGMGFTLDTIKGYTANYQAASLAYTVFFREDSEAVNATRIRDEKVEALSDFLSDFIALAKIAFADQPELLIQIS